MTTRGDDVGGSEVVVSRVWPLVVTLALFLVGGAVLARFARTLDTAVVLACAFGLQVLLFIARLAARRSRAAYVEVDEGGDLTADGARLATRAEIRKGHLLLRDGKLRAVLDCGRRTVDVQVPDDANGFALLSSLGLVPSRTLAVVEGSALLGSNVVLTEGGVEVGRRSRKRFVPFGSILRVRREPGRLVLVLLGGGELRMGPASRTPDGWADLEALAFVAERVAFARAHAPDIGLLARGDRDVHTWLAGVTTAQAGGAFRGGAIAPARLWAVVEDVAAPATARAAAAAALRRHDDAPSRLRVLASSCEDPRLRVALDAVASGADEASLASTFDAVRDDAAAR